MSVARDLENGIEFSTQYTLFEGDDWISETEWQELEQISQHEQKKFLEKYKFKEEPVNSLTKNVRRGDHIFYQGGSGKLYNHHLLCTNIVTDEVNGDKIHTIEYNGSFSLSASSQSAATSNPLAFAAIKERKLTYEELKDEKAKIRKWPEQLERFPIDEVIERALSRKQERDYHVFDNNCEHFVNWCKCGLNTSLQVKPWYKPMCNCVKAVCSGMFEGIKKYGVSKGVPALFKAVGNVSDEILGAISSPLSPVGFVVGGVIETAFATYYICRDHKRMKKGHLPENQFQINSVATCAKAAGHVEGGIAGSVMGSVAGPLGSIVGGAIGYGVGHAAGSAIGWCYEHACIKCQNGISELREGDKAAN